MLAPVGNKIFVERSEYEGISSSGFHTILLDSGTSALAFAICIAKYLRKTDAGEVIIPAYGCPDLIAACAFAKVKAVLVDIDQNSPNYNREQLLESITNKTIAIVAVNFLGIKESLSELRKICDTHKLFLIEDNAQWFPEFDSHQETFIGDIATLSFGKGKPVSLLGGGQVYINSVLEQTADLEFVMNLHNVTKADNEKNWKTMSKIRLYNMIIRPRIYSLFYRIYKNKLGLTVYKGLDKINLLDKYREKLLQKNIEAYQENNNLTVTLYNELFRDSKNTVSLPLMMEKQTAKLLRYPVLFHNVDMKKKAIDVLQSCGLGATEFYEKELSAIAGVPIEHFRVHSQENAKSFAARLITLPTHAYTTEDDIKKIFRIIEAV